MKLLEVEDLRTEFRLTTGSLRAVNGVSFSVSPGETLAIVGESGSGKSVASMSVLRLLKSPPAMISGAVRFEGTDLISLSETEMRALRGRDIAMIFQEPMTSLNPVLTIGGQIVEALRLHTRLTRKQARQRATELLQLVGISGAGALLREYPHRLSGGMRQRVMIAMALACNPKLLIADEPTTALDVTIQAQIMDLLRDLRARLGTAIILITHDLGVVAEMADRVAVMYAGRIVEQGDVKLLFKRPLHPYTRGLLRAIPRLGARPESNERVRLFEIEGTVPDPRGDIAGCAFAPRCREATRLCREVSPVMEEKDDAHFVACHHEEGLIRKENTT